MYLSLYYLKIETLLNIFQNSPHIMLVSDLRKYCLYNIGITWKFEFNSSHFVLLSLMYQRDGYLLSNLNVKTLSSLVGFLVYFKN